MRNILLTIALMLLALFALIFSVRRITITTTDEKKDEMMYAGAKCKLDDLLYALKQYHEKFEQFPSEGDEFVDEMVQKNILTKIVKDPWGNQFNLTSVENEMQVRCRGKDGILNSSDDIFVIVSEVAGMESDG